jgi:transcriptional regulator with XRE-family HTH domain
VGEEEQAKSMAVAREGSFGARLRRLREAAGFTQEELAVRAGLSPDAIGTLERGQRKHPYPGEPRQPCVRGLGEEVFDAARAEGQAMTFEEKVAEALERRGDVSPPLAEHH